MGGPPLNKLYSMMLTIYSVTKLGEARAYHDKLSTFASPLIQSVLLIFALLSFICGPGIGYFDVYYDIHRHSFYTGMFTTGEVGYLIIFTYLMHTNRSQFAPSAHYLIDRCVLAMSVAAVVGICMSFNELFPGIDVNSMGEWIVFNIDFFCRFNMAMIIKYKCAVVPSKTQ